MGEGPPIDAAEVAALAAELVRAPGQNPPGEERATVDALARACDRLGIRWDLDEVVPGRPNLYATLPGGDGPGLLFLGHSDVVPVGDGWTVPPHGGTIAGGRLYGRGAADMKGGLAACLIAMAAVDRAGIALSGSVELAVTVDEEESALGIQHDLERRDRRNVLGCIVAEPTSLRPVIAARGDAYLKIAIGGRAAHAGQPAAGVNAIYGAARVVADLQAWNDELASAPHPLAGPGTVSVGLIDGGSGASIVAAECTVIADRRLLPTETGPAALDQLRQRLGRLGLEADGFVVDTELTLDMPGFETRAELPLVTRLQQAIRSAGGPEPQLQGWTAACDGGFLARDAGIDVVVFGPGSVSEQAHRADEWVDTGELATAARSYAATIVQMLSRR